MNESEIFSQALRTLGALGAISLLYSGTAVYVRERAGRNRLIPLMLATAAFLFLLRLYTIWNSATAAGSTGLLTPGLIAGLAALVLVPLLGSTYVVSRQQQGVAVSRRVWQAFGGAFAFWGAALLALIPVLLLDFIRFFAM